MPVRVLQVVGRMHRGGMETMIMNYYRKINREKVQFDFLVHYPEPGEYDEEIRRLGGRIYIMPRTVPQNYFRYRKELDRFFSEHREYRVVHGHLSSAAFVFNEKARQYGVPCRIIHAHNNNVEDSIKGRLSLLTSRWGMAASNCLLACSREAADFYFGRKTGSSGQVTIIKNAIDIREYCCQDQIRRRMRDRLNLHEKFVIGHIGRFFPQKNHLFLIDIFQRVHEKKPESVLLLIGGGPLMPRVREKVEAYGLRDAVRFLGVRDDVPQLLQAMDVFVLPSLFEGLGIVLIEAQAAGLRCFTSSGVVSREADVTDLVEHIRLGDPPSVWAGRILASGGAAYERRNTQAEIRAAGYDIDEQARRLEEFYLEKSR